MQNPHINLLTQKHKSTTTFSNQHNFHHQSLEFSPPLSIPHSKQPTTYHSPSPTQIPIPSPTTTQPPATPTISLARFPRLPSLIYLLLPTHLSPCSIHHLSTHPSHLCLHTAPHYDFSAYPYLYKTAPRTETTALSTNTPPIRSTTRMTPTQAHSLDTWSDGTADSHPLVLCVRRQSH